MRVDDPPPEAYSRVTNPERLRPLHSFADALVETLVATYELETVERDVPLTLRGHVVGAERSVRLVPAGGGAPVTIWWTSFPGLVARFGEWSYEEYPDCGCDACGDDAAELAVLVHKHVTDVTMGAYQEWVADGFHHQGSAEAWSGHSLDATDPVPSDYRSEWRPWVHRPVF